MAEFNNTGAFNVNGSWATSVRYDAKLNSGELEEVSLTFKNGRDEVARAKLDREEALELLGARNVKTIESAAGEQSAGSRENVKGELRGKRLEFRHIALTDESSRKPANTISLDSRAVEPAMAPNAASSGDEAKPQNGEEPPKKARTEPQSGDRTPSFEIPDDIARKFLRVDNKYYFQDRTLAFVDRGTKLKIESENAEVVRLALDIAQARGWEGIRVTGTDSFRARVWREASLRDIPVKGYEATELERQDIERARNRRMPTEAPPTAAPPVNQVQESSANGMPKENRPSSRVIVGTLKEHGAAPYKNDEAQPVSYFVTMVTANSTKTLWGVGLEKAIRDSATQPKVGDAIGIQHVGMETVRVNVPVKDGEGNVTGERSIDTHRNVWVVEKRSFVEAKRAGAVSEPVLPPSAEESATRLKEAAAIHDNQLPVLDARVNGARQVAQIALGRVAQLYAVRFLNEPDRQRFVDAVNRAIGELQVRGEAIPEPRVRIPESRELTQESGRTH